VLFSLSTTAAMPSSLEGVRSLSVWEQI
jgi:hypothetical protein